MPSDDPKFNRWKEEFTTFQLAMQSFPEAIVRDVLDLVWVRNRPWVSWSYDDATVAVWMDMLSPIDPPHLAADGARMAVESEAIDGPVAFCHVYQAAKLLGGC